jgi:N-acetylmuramoyl-L-alanine amidase
MPGRHGRHHVPGNAPADGLDRRRLLRAAAALGVLVPGTAEGIAWLMRHAAGAPAASTTRREPAPQSGPPSAAASPSPSPRPSHAAPLAGKVVVIDPGHNSGNPHHVVQIDRLVQAGGFMKPCDTVGAETDAGYPEFDFTLDVARRARVILRAAGAKVILTQNGHMAYGPCVTARAAIGNRAQADAAVSIHADGGPPEGYGFAALVPELVQNQWADNSSIIEPSHRLGHAVVRHFASATGQPASTYLGEGGIQPRNDLAGLNLSLVPKVFIECANMRNSDDAAKLTSPRWRQRAAHGIADSITAFLTTG